eukprot:g3156.t1
MGVSLLTTVLVAAGPCLSMLVGSALVFFLRFSKIFQATFQNFSAGILLAAIGNELFPLANNGSAHATSPPTDAEVYVGQTAGFAVGLLFMFGIEHVVEYFGGDENEEDDDDAESEGKHDEENDDREDPLLLPLRSARTVHTAVARIVSGGGDVDKILVELSASVDDDAKDEDVLDEITHKLMYAVDRERRSLTKKTAISVDARDELREHVKEIRAILEEMKRKAKGGASVRAYLTKVSRKLRHLHDDHVDLRFSRWKLPLAPKLALVPSKVEGTTSIANVPWTTVFAVTVDAAVDGVLIGLALSANRTAGISMSVATVIEMGFLGISFSDQVKRSTSSSVVHACICVVPPVAIVMSAIVGHEIGSALEGQQGVFIGFISFSIVAILFLVTQELLREAQEAVGENAFVSTAFFVGLLAALLLDRVLD